MKQFVLFLTGAIGLLPVASAACQDVKNLKLAQATVTAAEVVADGAFQPAGRGGKGPNPYASLKSFCRVAATLAPTSDSDIKIEVWMPLGDGAWNSDLESVGNGAWAGSISYPAMATALGAGFATASTDTGHTGGNPANFIPGHPEKLIDFAYRSVHEMTLAAKAIIAANYGRAPSKSYWNGCSTGGRQALAEVQLYPGDYDGVIAGAAANYTTQLQGAQVWTTTLMNRDPASRVPRDKYAVIHAAALAACDANDGVKDGVIDHPTACKFDPATIQCKAGDEPTCLTAAQVAAVKGTYAGPKDSKGRSMFPGLEPGSEIGWNTLSGEKPMALADEVYKYIVYEDPNWNYLTFDPERDMTAASKKSGKLMDSIDANLKPFFGHGGKLLMYHGWADPGIPPRNSVNYYSQVVDKVGKRDAASSIRLFMVPGMGHCAGGDGPDKFDAMSAIKDWVEQGKAPESMVASRVRNGATDRTRPLCAYPNVAKYKGSGSTDDAANFSCVAP